MKRADRIERRNKKKARRLELKRVITLAKKAKKIYKELNNEKIEAISFDELMKARALLESDLKELNKINGLFMGAGIGFIASGGAITAFTPTVGFGLTFAGVGLASMGLSYCCDMRIKTLENRLACLREIERKKVEIENQKIAYMQDTNNVVLEDIVEKNIRANNHNTKLVPSMA